LGKKNITLNISLISSVSAGINSAAHWIKRPIVEDPTFEVVNAGMGSMLIVKMSPQSQCYSPVGCTIGLSSKVKTQK